MTKWQCLPGRLICLAEGAGGRDSQVLLEGHLVIIALIITEDALCLSRMTPGFLRPGNAFVGLGPTRHFAVIFQISLK